MKEEFEQEIKGVFNPKTDMPGVKSKKEAPKTNEELKKDIQKNPYFNMKDPKKVEEDWKNKSNEELKRTGSSNRVVDRFWNNFLVVLLILTVITGIIFISWGIYNDKFKTSIVDNSTVVCEGSNFTMPKIEIPKCPENHCELSCGNVTIFPEIYLNNSN